LFGECTFHQDTEHHLACNRWLQMYKHMTKTVNLFLKD
jgi:hypothetical protein